MCPLWIEQESSHFPDGSWGARTGRVRDGRRAKHTLGAGCVGQLPQSCACALSSVRTVGTCFLLSDAMPGVGVFHSSQCLWVCIQLLPSRQQKISINLSSICLSVDLLSSVVCIYYLSVIYLPPSLPLHLPTYSYQSVYHLLFTGLFQSSKYCPSSLLQHTSSKNKVIFYVTAVSWSDLKIHSNSTISSNFQPIFDNFQWSRGYF